MSHQMKRCMRLMRYSPSNWLDTVAMRVEGAASSWVNAVLQDVAAGRRAAFLTWRQFTQAMVHRFEPVTETEEAQKQLRALRQTGRVSGYIQKFQELQYRLPNMMAEEAFHAFLTGLVPTCRNTWVPTFRGTWRRRWQWPSVWRCTVE